MNIEQMKALADAKAQEAFDAWGEEAPDVDKAKALDKAAVELGERLERMRALLTIKTAAAEEDKPEPGGIVVVEDETDKKAKGKTWGFGEFLQAIANDDMLARPFKAADEPGHYDLGKALGDKVVGSLTAAKHAKAILGMSEMVPADGGFLVGVDQRFDILGRVYNVGQLLPRVDMVGISAGSNGMTFNFDAEVDRRDGFRRGGVRYYWACEAADKTPQHPTFRRLELNLNKIIGLVYATDELLQDAGALESYIMSILPEELKFGVEDAIINGPGGGMPLGILTSPCLVTQGAEPLQANTTVVSENIINMWSRRWVGARDYVWLINQDVTPQLQQMNLGVGAGGVLTYMPPGGLSGAPYGTIYGRPVLEIEYCPTLGTLGDIILASLSEYQMIEKGGIQTASSIHVQFLTDQTVFRFVYRCDGEPKWNAPLRPHASAVTQGPFVVLAGRP